MLKFLTVFLVITLTSLAICSCTANSIDQHDAIIINLQKKFKVLGEYEIEGKTYFYRKQSRNWKQAQDECSLAHMEPLNLDSNSEQEIFFDLLEESDLHSNFHIGGKKHKNHWAWSPKLSLIDLDLVWSEGEPSNTDGKEDCLTVFKDFKGEVGFSDVQCNAKFSYFCQVVGNKQQ